MGNTFAKLRQDPAFWVAMDAWREALENDRGARAELRRARTPDEALISRAFHRHFLATLRDADMEVRSSEYQRLALPVGVLAHAKRLEGSDSFLYLLAKADKGSQDVRDARLLRLLAIPDDDRDGLYFMLIRLAKMLGGVADIKSLVTGAFWWGERTRRAWALEYYTASPKGE